MKLSTAEEQLMQHLWRLEKAFMKDLLEAYPEPKPANTTIATLIKRMSNKGFVGYTLHGALREYHPLVKKKDYFSRQVNRLVKHFFNGSPSQFVSFFSKEANLTKEQLEDLKTIIDSEIKKK